MLVARSMHPGWLSNAYAVADRAGGTAVFVDSGADVAPLVAAVEGWGASPAAILRTHSHHDHVDNEDELVRRYGIPVVAEPGEWSFGELRVRGLATPGHADEHVAFVVDGEAVFTGDVLFKDAVGGGDLEQVRASVLRLLELPDGVVVYPGHTDETTIGRERESNPFVRVWLGAEREGTERVSVAGRDATLVAWSPDYDGKGKAWVRFDDGADAIVGGSRVSRG
ncbi:MAG TPA: MBL fold metallo-hydrolase [Gaiellaceae bacterium]|nr:MBL fold metallo-hydrolase [Gaiellaceae bacterium]